MTLGTQSQTFQFSVPESAPELRTNGVRPLQVTLFNMIGNFRQLLSAFGTGVRFYKAGLIGIEKQTEKVRTLYSIEWHRLLSLRLYWHRNLCLDHAVTCRDVPTSPPVQRSFRCASGFQKDNALI